MTRTAVESQFATHDGQLLFYRHWPAVTSPRRGAVVLFHRGHEHSARMAHLVEELALPEFDFFAWDARGHGRSPGRRGFSPSFGTSVRDVQTFVDFIGAQHGVAEQDIHIIAQSVGAALVSVWAHDFAPRVRGLTLASPAFKIKLYVPFAIPGLTLLHKLFGTFFINSYVKPSFLTHDAARIASYRSDPLIARPIAVNILLGLRQAARRVVRDAHAIVAPVQLLISGADFVVHLGPQHEFFAGLGSTVKQKHVLPGFYHDTLGEQERGAAVAKIRDFILELFAKPPTPVDLGDAHRRGVTAEESRALAKPLGPLSPRGIYWALTRLALRTLGKLSAGIRLGHATGFDSGSTLDYVYRNEPQGAPVVGAAIDRAYLGSLGWRGIRVRKLHLEQLLLEAMRRLSEAQQPIHILDVAAGHGRYILDAVKASPVMPASIRLRDYSANNVRDGRALLAARQLQHVATFDEGDAFDRSSLAAAKPRPTLCVVSGLYELFADNDLVARSLAGIADATEPGGYLVYTGQPWHPQLEFIARALTSHRQGQAWVMRRRTQAELDQLVAAAGFHKLTQLIDEWGIFTVSLAQRVVT